MHKQKKPVKFQLRVTAITLDGLRSVDSANNNKTSIDRDATTCKIQ
jgi:hypothetical protein